NLEKALEYYEKDLALTEELYASYPQHVGFKNGLAISYIQLGSEWVNQQDLEKGRDYYQQAEALYLELVQDAPQFVAYRKNLEWVQEKLNNIST
ncbi:MAG: hypothetical protein AAFO96_07590, partial [Bacteroidota bacterium]